MSKYGQYCPLAKVLEIFDPWLSELPLKTKEQQIFTARKLTKEQRQIDITFGIINFRLF